METATAMRIGLIVMALGMLWPLWLSAQRIIYGRRNWLRMAMVVLYTCLLVPMATALPFLLSWGNSVAELELLTDFVLFGMLPIAVLALGSYVLDHVVDWPQGVLITAAACLTVALLPFGLLFAEPRLAEAFQIEVSAVQESGDAGLDQGTRAEDQADGNPDGSANAVVDEAAGEDPSATEPEESEPYQNRKRRLYGNADDSQSTGTN